MDICTDNASIRGSLWTIHITGNGLLLALNSFGRNYGEEYLALGMIILAKILPIELHYRWYNLVDIYFARFWNS